MRQKRPFAASTAVVLSIGLLAAAAAPALAYTQEEQQELQIGQQVYQQYSQKGLIVTRSPDYAILLPIGRQIARVADKKYFVPFHFILVRNSQPNAFAVPGGNVYVTTSMMTFVKNREELAGVLCHETSHDIHHDVMHLQPKYQTIGVVGGLLSALIGNSQIGQLLLNIGANGYADQFSRHVETNADHTGAYTCAQAGINPWGMVWLMKRFENTSQPGLEFLSDHPSDNHRISDLETEFRSDPKTFARFNPNPASATPLR